VDPGVFGNEFGRKFGILSPDDHVTSVAIGEPGEFYINFGLIGVFLAMPLIGAVYWWLADVLRNRSDQPVVLAIYAVAAWPIVQSQGTITAQGLMGVLKLVAVLSLVVAAVNGPARVIASRMRGVNKVEPRWT
jgi:hypothetical protein